MIAAAFVIALGVYPARGRGERLFWPHRACAIRCISGGIPPVFLVQQKGGSAIYILLVSAEGKPVNVQVL